MKSTNKTTLYAAYGSNLNLRQMSVRCPTAVPIATAILKGWQLEFRGVATLVKNAKSETPVGVWEITETDEQALDRYEGYPRMYRKEWVELIIKGKPAQVMLYLMNDGLPCLPSKYYLDAIAEGYENVGLDTSFLIGALEYTKDKMREGKRYE